MRQRRDMINVNADPEFREMVAELRRADTAVGSEVPTMSDVIRKAVVEAHARLHQKGRRK